MKITAYYIKLITGYILLFVIMACFMGMIYNERIQKSQIDLAISEIRGLRRLVNNAHEQILELSLLGESAAGWDMNDYNQYRGKRIVLDSLLLSAEPLCKEFIPSEEIDSLRRLFMQKEMFMYRFMQIFHKNFQTDEELLHELTKASRSVVTTNRKSNGGTWFSKIFKRKEKQSEELSLNRIQSLNTELTEEQREWEKMLENYIDSLQWQNTVLNGTMSELIENLDLKTQNAIQDKEIEIQRLYSSSLILIVAGIGCSFLLLVFSFITIYRDRQQHTVTNKMLETALKQNCLLVDSQKKIMLAVSHDVRGPLNIISGNAELAMNTREKKRRNIYLNNIGIVCRHVVHLLNNLLDVYRLNEAKEIRNDVPFNLHELLERIAFGFSHVINDKGILFDCNFKNTKVKLYGDMDRIEQIIDNLLTNAVKFTEFGTISFHVRYYNGNLILEVKDTGIGMTEETLSRIFRPFERQTSAANADGYGLGLSITQGLVNLLGGTIEVTSSVNRGSMFRVTLPLPETNEPIECENRILPHSEHLPHNVLVIDDDSMQRNVIKEMLERNGVACTVCSSVKEIVKVMRCMDYDLLLSDIQMPGTNGLELLTLLRSSNIGNSRTIPVVAMTARSDKEKNVFLDTGFTSCIYKPFSSSELLSLLSTIKKCQEDENREVDFSMMLAEVNDKVKLLDSFIKQSKQDVEELTSAMNRIDRKKLSEIVHRMHPMWELLQMEDALSDYRALLKNDTATDDAVREHTQQIMECTAKLIAEAENEIKRQTNEKENTDS